MRPEVKAEAAAWVARLHSAGRTRPLEAALRKWLTADPEHARAFEVATEAWDIGGSLSPRALPQLSRRSSRQPTTKWRYLAAAACLGGLAVAGMGYLGLRTSAVTTAVGEQRALTLRDGTRVFLNTATRLVVHYDDKARRVELAAGEALFDVARETDRPFVVTAGDRQVTALGTAFVVRREPAQIAVTLIDGKVSVSRQEVRAKARNEIILTPGERLILAANKPARFDKPPVDKITAWRRGEVILDKTRLADAVDEMNRYNEVKLAVEGPRVNDIRVSGIFQTGDSTRFAKAVAETYRLNVQRHDRRIVISDPVEK